MGFHGGRITMAVLTPILSARSPGEPEHFQQIQVGFTGQDLLACQSLANLQHFWKAPKFFPRLENSYAFTELAEASKSFRSL